MDDGVQRSPGGGRVGSGEGFLYMLSLTDETYQLHFFSSHR